jgi:hypothetical protein
MNTQPERTWWQRNWKWVLVAAALSLILIVAGFVFAIIQLAGSMMRSAEPYRLALSRAQAHPEVIAALGTPIELGWMPQGSIKIENQGGVADIDITLGGPRGAATIDVVATRRATQWHYTVMQVKVGTTTIDLLTPEERADAPD